VLTRVAASHLRVGTFQFFAAREDLPKLRQLAEYAIARHDADLAGQPGRHLALLDRVGRRQASLIARWMNVGFIHGVMNTDNMTISGETIDYGPCAFMEAYDPDAVFSSIDHNGRYAYGNQPLIARWNLARLAEALLPLAVADGADPDQAVAEATAVIDAFPALYQAALLQGQREKLGLSPNAADEEADTALVAEWLGLLHVQRVDFTLAWRRLADAAEGRDESLEALFSGPQSLRDWLARWRERCARDGNAASAGRAARMRLANPWIIPRNHRVEEALEAASAKDDLGPFERLLAAVRSPFDQVPDHLAYAQPAPADVTARYQTFCGT
jgi:uncharacterized protein YdiU (UPF0061 family)